MTLYINIASVKRSLGGSAKRLAIAALALSVAGSQVFASGPGTTTAELLKIPIGARAVGMGEAYTAAADDSSALEWNPAGLQLAPQKEASFMHSSLIDDIHYEHLSYVSPGDRYSFGASTSYLGYGSISGYNDLGQSIGDQTAYSAIFNAGMATELLPRWDAGFSLAGIREKLSNDSAGTFSANAGTIYTLDSKPLDAQYRLGFSVLNMGPGLKFVSESAPLPRKIKMGAEVMHLKNWPLNLTADVTVPNDNSAYIGLGSEYWFRDVVALRLGYAGSNDEGKNLRVGMGLKLHQVLFDYAYGGFGDFGATHRIELGMHFGEPTHQMNGEERSILKDAKREEREGNYVQAILDMDGLLDKDQDNSKVLKQMIDAHQAMLRKELNDTIAQNGNDADQTPSPDEFALQDLAPGQAAIAQGPGAAMGGKVSAASQLGNDPLGLDNLPDATHLDETPTPNQNAVSAPDPSLGETEPTPNQIRNGAAMKRPLGQEPQYQPVDAAPGVEHKVVKTGEAIKPGSNDVVPEKDNTPVNVPSSDETAMPERTAPAVTNTAPAATPLPDYNAPAPTATMAPATPTRAPASGASPAQPATPDNSTSGNGTLVNPSDIYGQ